MKSNVINKQNKAIMGFVILIVMTICLLLLYPKDNNRVYVLNYYINSLCLLISVLMLTKLFIQNKMDIFEPITVIGFIYITMYFFTPLYDMKIGEYSWFGYDVFIYGVKATIIELIGFVVFYFCYTHKFIIKRTEKYEYKMENKKHGCDVLVSENKSDTIVIVIMIIYIIAFGANLYYLTRISGNSILYSLTAGILGSGNTNDTTSNSIGFISMLSYSLPTATLLYWEFGKSNLMKVSLFLPMFILQVTRGFRFFIIQIVISFFAYYFLKKETRPKMLSILMLLIVVLVPVVIMTVFRNSIRSGGGVDFSVMDFERIRKAFDEAIWENFRIYRNFYAMVDKIPSQYPFVYGRQMIIGTIAMVIPRIIWPGKVSTQAGVGLEYIVGSRLKGVGQAYPNIGEYYYALGIAGVVLFMAIYGIWARRLKNKYINSKDGLDIILYAVLLGGNLQLLIRGYTPSNFWYLVFSVLPVWIIRGLRRKCKESVQ